MKRKLITIFSTLLLVCSLFCGCADKNSVQENNIIEETPASESSVEKEIEETPAQNEIAAEEEQAAIPDGTYMADFDTDSSMFHVSEACDGKGILTVKNGEMTIHISLMSKKIVNLYPGLAEDAEKDGAELLMPTEDTVTFSDGLTEVVYGFDVPVPVLEEEFDLALVGTKGTWYDHKVKVSNPEPMEEEAQAENILQLEDGIYTVELAFEGGSGKAKVLSPATVTVSGENVTATIQWSSPNYD